MKNERYDMRKQDEGGYNYEKKKRQRGESNEKSCDEM